MVLTEFKKCAWSHNETSVVSTHYERTHGDLFIYYAHWVLADRPHHSPPPGIPTSWPRPARRTSSGVAGEPRSQRSSAAGRRFGSRRGPGPSRASAGEPGQSWSLRLSSAEPWSRSQGSETEEGRGICGERCLKRAWERNNHLTRNINNEYVVMWGEAGYIICQALVLICDPLLWYQSNISGIGK